jgi:CheY-like chemotaxis protein
VNDSLTYSTPRRYDARVLVAEDNPVHRSLVRSLLEQMGCAVEAVSDGQEALESFASENYDLILMDWRMPRLDGVTATQKIRQTEQNRPGDGDRRVPIIALTAHALPGDRSRCLSAGMDDYLCKPVSRRNLDLMLTKWGSPLEEAFEPAFERKEPAVEEDSDSVLDMSQVEELAAIERDGAPGLVSHLIDTYLADAPAKLTLLQTAAAEDDSLGIQVATHSFKSASSTVGAHRLYRMCNDLERNARARHLNCLADRVEEILAEFKLVERELEALRAQFDSKSS